MTLYERNGDDISRGLVGHWKLNDFKADPSATIAIDQANFNDGTITKSSNTTGINALNPDAINFDGTDDVISLGNPTKLQLDKSQSVCFWIKTSATSKYLYSTRNNSVGGFSVFMRSNGLLQAFIGITGQGASVSTINDGMWHHISVVYNESSIKYFIDGQLDAEDISLTGAFDNSAVKLIGKRDGSSGLYIGALQNLRIYNRALTQGEANKLYRLRK